MRDIWLFEISNLIRCQLHADSFHAFFDMRNLCRTDNRRGNFREQPSERNLDSGQPFLLCKLTDAVDNDGVFFFGRIIFSFRVRILLQPFGNL